MEKGESGVGSWALGFDQNMLNFTCDTRKIQTVTPVRKISKKYEATDYAFCRNPDGGRKIE